MRQRSRDHHALLFAAAELVQVPVGQPQHLCQLHIGAGNPQVFLSLQRQGAVMAGSPHQNDFRNRVREVDAVFLGDDGKKLAQVAAAVSCDITIVQTDIAARAQHP